jgi:SAM-dependent methyltransferase
MKGTDSVHGLSVIHRIFDKWHVAARRRKMREFLRLCRPGQDDPVLDVGVLGEEHYEAANFFVHEYPYSRALTALGIEDLSGLRARYPSVKFVTYDGGRFPFKDDNFAVCHSNAVIEHVGDWQQQQFFVSEMVRVARRGFFTTPNRWFPIELHTKLPLLHYLPWPLFVRISRLAHGGLGVEGVRLLSHRQLGRLMGGASVKNYSIMSNRLLGMTVTFSVHWSRDAA